MTSNKYRDENFYHILGVDVEADETAIRKAYRKKALECHPDKNPNNPKASELFHELSKALEILTDKAARTAYDNVWKAKKAAELRHKKLDSKRQKLKDDLEKRELESQDRQSNKIFKGAPKSDEDVLQEQIERLRREGSRLLAEEHALLREQLQKSLAEHMQQNRIESTHRLKIKWKADKKDPLNGGYNINNLTTYLKKYGDIVALVMSKKFGSALVEFKSLESAEMALAYEKGLVENPLNFDWIVLPSNLENQRKTTNTQTDYEDLVMRKLRQAEERKRLIEQLQKDDS